MANVFDTVKEQLTLENVLSAAIRTPGVRVDRAVFLWKELLRYCREDVIETAIQYNPARAGIPKKVINKISQTVI